MNWRKESTTLLELKEEGGLYSVEKEKGDITL